MWRIYSLTSGKWHISSLAARGSMHDALKTWQRRVVLCIDIAAYIGRRCMAGDEECIVERLLRLWKKKKRFRGCSGRDSCPDKCISPSPPLPHLAPAAPFAVPPPPTAACSPLLLPPLLRPSTPPPSARTFLSPP